jgi:hypothetical protein
MYFRMKNQNHNVLDYSWEVHGILMMSASFCVCVLIFVSFVSSVKYKNRIYVWFVGVVGSCLGF